MKVVATKNITISAKVGDNRVKVTQLVSGKVVSPSKLRELSLRQLNDYTKEVYESADLAFMTPEDKRFYKKNIDHPDMEWALDMAYNETTD